jgi:hypothetical protein
MWQFLAVTIQEKLKKNKDLKEEHTRILQLKMVYGISLVLSTTTIIRNRLHECFKLLNIRPGLYILKQKAVILNTSCVFRKVW